MLKQLLCALAIAVPAAGVLAGVPLEGDIRAVAALSGEPGEVGAAGFTADDQRVLTIENLTAFDPAASGRRLVIVGGFDGDARSAEAVLALVRWFKRAAPSRTRREWSLSALPLATFAAADKQSLERWITFQAPDVLVEVRDDGKALGLTSIGSSVIGAAAGPAAIEKILAAAPAGRSGLRTAIAARVSRTAMDVALVLARRYPGSAAISYIPAVAWTNTLRLAKLSGDDALAVKVRTQTAPWTTGAQPLFGDRILLTSVAGTMIFAELGGEARRLAVEGARLAAATKSSGIAEYGQGWTDDMFMSSAILSRMGEYDAAAKLMTSYAGRLQRPDGVFVHATDGPFAWGRGNGFAATGLAELLTVLPPDHPARPNLLNIYRRHMDAATLLQSPDGMWREVLDEPAAYREETATAMLLTAMARGIRLGWLNREYRRAVERAWLGLLAHVADDGTVIDVCTGTGAGPTARYYLERAAITGPDDRGGAMALMAAMEMVALRAR